MATWVKPELPGTSIRIVGETVQTISPSFSDVVAVPAPFSWGPVGFAPASVDGGQPGLYTSFAQFEGDYGSSDTPGHRAVLQAFQGMGLPGQGGAGGVLVYRMAASGAAVATRSATNTSSAPALRLDAKYKGTDGNLISYSVGPDPRDGAQDMLRILFRGAEVERYVYAKTDITALVTAINVRPSSYVVATMLATGVALAVQAGQALTSGADGDTLTSAEWLDALDALEFKQFSLLAPYNLTDPSIRASLLAWVQQQEAANRPVMVVVGGAAGETLATAITRSQAMADPHVVNFGVGTYHDSLLNRDLSTAELAPRIAGVLAARGLKSALTFADLAGLTVVGSTGAASDELAAAKNAGVTVLGQSESGDSELHVVWGVTSFTSKTDPARPYAYFSEPRLVRLNDIFIRRMRQWANSFVVGDLPVNNDTRDAVRTEGRNIIEEFRRDGLLDDSPEPFIRTPISNDPSLRDAILFEFGWQAAYTTNFVIGMGRVR
jgi:hypothetical protein